MEQNPVEASFEKGRLRERVKNGELDPRVVLEWAKKQTSMSWDFIRFLQRRIASGKVGIKKEKNEVVQALEQGVKSLKTNPPHTSKKEVK